MLNFLNDLVLFIPKHNQLISKSYNLLDLILSKNPKSGNKRNADSNYCAFLKLRFD